MAVMSSSTASKTEPMTISMVSVMSELVIKNKTRNKDFRSKMGLRKKRKKRKMKRRIWKVLYINKRGFFL